MRLDELQHDAEELRRHTTPSESPFDVAAVGQLTLDQELVRGSDIDLDPLNNPETIERNGDDPWLADKIEPRISGQPTADGAGQHMGVNADQPDDAATTVAPLPPPPTDEARDKRRWRIQLPPLLTRKVAARAVASDVPPVADELGGQGTRRQMNVAPILAMGLLGIVVLALVVGLLNTQRVDVEASLAMDAKRKAAERAIGLLGGKPQATPPPPIDPPKTVGVEASPEPPSPIPADGRERHEAMLSAIKTGAVLASLPPTALAQPSPLPADLPPATIVTSTAASRSAQVPFTPPPPKKVALAVEGAPSAPPAASRVTDPLAGARVSGALKGAPAPHHRVYQLRESDGEWLGYVAPADADPLAAGVWAGSGDLLRGGWRVAEVTSQRLTLVGPNGGLEIIRP